MEAWDARTGQWLAQIDWYPHEVYQVDVNADGTHLIVAGTRDRISLVPLDLFDRPLEMDAGARSQTQAELFSGQRIHERGSTGGQTAHNLTTDDWISLWQDATGKSPLRYRPSP